MNEWINFYPSLIPACDPGVLWNEWISEESQAHLPGLSLSVAGRGTCWSPRWSQETPSVERSRESSVSISGHRRETGLPEGPGTHLSEGRLAKAGTLSAPRGPCVRSSLSGLVEQWWFFFLTFEFIRQLLPVIPEVLRELSGHHVMSWVRPLPKSYMELLGPQNVTAYGEEGL